jgi:hypothetical protein
MSVNLEIHDAVSIKIEDVTRSGSTTWRSIHVTEKDGRIVSFTFYAPSGTETVPMIIGGQDE